MNPLLRRVDKCFDSLACRLQCSKSVYREYGVKGRQIGEVAKEFGISKNTLYKVSHDCFGTTILDYITKKRIDSACLLLKDQSLSITEICDRIGISDYNYFFKLFKRHMGVSPRKFRSVDDAGATRTN